MHGLVIKQSINNCISFDIRMQFVFTQLVDSIVYP